MNLRSTIALFGLGFWLLPLASDAQTPISSPLLRYKFAPGQKLRYRVTRDPYFADPARAIETADPRVPYRAPIVERLTEQVRTVGPDGTATIKVTIEPERGFEDDAHPIAPIAQTVTVTARGQVLASPAGTPAPDLLRAFFRLPSAPPKPGLSGPVVAFPGGKTGLAIITQTLPPQVTQGHSPDHDGTLLQTTRSAQSDRIVFDVGAGNLLRQTSTLTATLSLVMTNRGARGAADFGRVVPNVETVQTLTVERKEDSAPASPSLALAGPQSGN